MNKFISTYFTRQMALILAMAFSSGLPIALTVGTLQVWMASEHVDLRVIGIFSLVGLPYTLKFIWAPIMDRFVPPFLGRRRGWMLITQLALIASITALGSSDPIASPINIAILAFLVAFFSASQDIVIDAYRAEILSTEELGAGAALAILGYRLGMLTSGAFALILSDHFSWQGVYWMMAACMSVGMVATFLTPEPSDSEEITPKSLRDAIINPFVEYFKRPGAFEILVFIILYKLGDVMAMALSSAFLIELGFSRTEIGAVGKAFGLIASIVGSLIGGGFVARFGLKKSLWILGIVQGAATLSYAALAYVGKNFAMMALAIGAENFCSGLGNAPFIAFLMFLCNKRFTATQYALLTSLAALARVFVGAPTGFIVQAIGWTSFYLICTLVALPGLALIKYRFHIWAPDKS